MHLIRIAHIRCGDIEYLPSGGTQTLLWADLDMTREDIDRLIREAEKLYLKELHEVPKDVPSNPGGLPPYEAYPTKTVQEVRATWEEQRARYLAYTQAKDRTKRDFSTVLREVGKGRLKYFHDIESFENEEDETPTALGSLFDFEVDWGHQHGLHINYGITPSAYPKMSELVKTQEP